MLGKPVKNSLKFTVTMLHHNVSTGAGSSTALGIVILRIVFSHEPTKSLLQPLQTEPSANISEKLCFRQEIWTK